MHFDILSLFPEYFETPFQQSILKRALENGLISIGLHDIRTFSQDKHKKVDERPFGGGPGMLLTPQPTIDALRSVKREGTYVVYMSAQGKKLTQEKCEELAKKQHLVLLSGHYEGIDERIIEKEVDEEISIGDYVLTSGCPAILVLIDAVSRFIPGVLGHPDAAFEDSFCEGSFEGPQYTRPEEYEGLAVPPVLISGHHANIRKWREEKGLEKMQKNRPDLYNRLVK